LAEADSAVQLPALVVCQIGLLYVCTTCSL